MATRNVGNAAQTLANGGTTVDTADVSMSVGAPSLMRISEVDKYCAPTSARATILRWLREFIGRPHPNLGRAGPICPFVPGSLQLDTIWIAEIGDADLSFDALAAIVDDYRTRFLATEPASGPDATNKAFLIGFPHLVADTAVIDRVQHALKYSFVEKGMMLGEFHASNDSPGLRNPDFRPLRSPIPMLAIRHMVDSDLPFMAHEKYTPNERSAFLRSYLFRLGGVLKQSRFDEALGYLLAVEASIRAAETRRAEMAGAAIGGTRVFDEQLAEAAP
jgi:hypothetical protein